MRAQSYAVPAGVFLFLLVSGAAFAQEPLSLRQVVEEAAKNDPETQSLRLEKEVLEASKIRATTWSNPTVEAEVTTGALTGSRDERSFSLGLSQEFPLWGKRALRVKVADAAVAEVETRLTERIQQITGEMRLLYLDRLRANEQARIAAQAAELAAKLRQLAQARLEEGDIPEYEVNLAKAEEAAANSRRRNAEREAAKIKLEIILAAGLPQDTELADEPGTVALVEAQALERSASRPDIKRTEAEKLRAEAELVAVKRDYLPDLTAGISIQRETSAIEVEGRTAKDTDHLIGLKISMPLPVFNLNAAEIREATARVSGAEQRRRLLLGRVEREVKTAFLNWQFAKTNRERYEKEVLPPARENVLLLHEAYGLGEVGIAEVIQEQRKFLDTMERYNELLHSERDTELKAKTAAGLPLEGGLK